jgi:hypothetical protein
MVAGPRPTFGRFLYPPAGSAAGRMTGMPLRSQATASPSMLHDRMRKLASVSTIPPSGRRFYVPKDRDHSDRGRARPVHPPTAAKARAASRGEGTAGRSWRHSGDWRRPGTLGAPVDCLSLGLMHIVAFTLYLIVVFPGGAPVVTNAGTWRNATDCRAAADAAFVPQNSQGQSPSFSFVCVPRSSMSSFGPR